MEETNRGDLDGRKFLVVGATGELGSRIARELHSRGASLTLSGRDEVRLRHIADQLGAAYVAADLTLPDGPAGIADALGESMLDGVVYAAGVVAFGPLAELEEDTLDELLLTNFVGYARLLRALIPRLGKGAQVVQLSAVVAESPTAGMAAYSASKAAVSAFGKAAALELRRSGIRVLDVRPPHTETGLATRPIDGQAPRLPQGKDPDAVARRIVEAIAAGERDLPSSSFD